MFSIGNKLYETSQNAQVYRALLESDAYYITSFDYNFVTNTFYFADEKNNKVLFYICFKLMKKKLNFKYLDL